MDTEKLRGAELGDVDSRRFGEIHDIGAKLVGTLPRVHSPWVNSMSLVCCKTLTPTPPITAKI